MGWCSVKFSQVLYIYFIVKFTVSVGIIINRTSISITNLENDIDV